MTIPPGSNPAEALRTEAAFLIERLNDLDDDVFTEDGARDWHGHVRPSIARLSQALTASSTDVEGLREEVRYWRRDLSARIWFLTGEYKAAVREKRWDEAAYLSTKLRPALASYGAANDQEWHTRCELCGEFLKPNEPYASGDDITGHARCLIDGAQDEPNWPDNAEKELASRVAEAEAALAEEWPEEALRPAASERGGEALDREEVARVATLVHGLLSRGARAYAASHRAVVNLDDADKARDAILALIGSPSPGPAPAVGQDGLREALGTPFMTCHAGEVGGPFVKLRYETLVECQRAHSALVRLFSGRPVEPSRQLIEALEWYGEQARLCRLIHSEGDSGRHALADDGGKRAAAALAALAPAARPAPEGSVLAELLSLFDADGALSCAGERQIEVVARARALAPSAPEPDDGSTLREACKPWEYHVGEPPDDDNPLLAVYDAGLTYGFELLAKDLGVESYQPCDGTETWQGDVAGTLHRILVAGGVICDETGARARLPSQASASPPVQPRAEGSNITIERIGSDRQGVTVRFAESEYDAEAIRWEEPLPGMVVALDVDGSILHIDIEDLKADMAAPPEGAGQEMQAARDVLAERRRQVEVEGWTPEHDDTHDKGEMVRAAANYAAMSGMVLANGAHDCDRTFGPPLTGLGYSAGWDYNLQSTLDWPLARQWWKPGPVRPMLVKAGALILAEIERLDRAETPPLPASGEVA